MYIILVAVCIKHVVVDKSAHAPAWAKLAALPAVRQEIDMRGKGCDSSDIFSRAAFSNIHKRGGGVAFSLSYTRSML